MYRGNYLFTDEQLFERKHADQQNFERTFKDEMPEFISLFQNSFERLKSIRSSIEPSSRDRNLNAVLMSGFVKGELAKLYGRIVKVDHTGRPYYSKDQQWMLYFKKLNANTFLPDNIETKHVKELHKQLSLDLLDRSPIIFIGYTVSANWEYLTGIYAVYIRNGSVIWRTNLGDHMSNINKEPIIRTKFKDAEIKPKEAEIQIRRRSS
jgi:hypothetical protein